MMARLPREPEAFAEQVFRILRRLRPELDSELTGPGEMLVNGRRLDLENLYRLVASDEDRGVEIVEQYLDHLFDDDSFEAATMSWEAARGRIMPRIQPVSIFRHLSPDLVAHVPYVNDTAMVFVIDMPHMTVSVTTDQCVRWGMCPEDLEEIARRNLDRYAEHLEFRSIETDDGGRAMALAMQDGYDASRLLLSDLHRRLAAELGGDFYVAIPSRDMFLALSVEPGLFINRVLERVDSDYRRLPYPITNRLFYVCRDGVAGTEARKAA